MLSRLRISAAVPYRPAPYCPAFPAVYYPGLHISAAVRSRPCIVSPGAFPPAASPPLRRNAAMAYDFSVNKLVMYGVARFGTEGERARVEAAGIRTRKLDLADPNWADLPTDFTLVLHFAADQRIEGGEGLVEEPELGLHR